MAIFRDFINLWKKEDLLSQAWNQSYEMLVLSHDIFQQAVTYLHEGENIETLKALKKRDKEINEFQRVVRRKVLTHYSIDHNTTDIADGLILINMVVDIERIGDYCKNILDLAINHPSSMNIGDASDDLNIVEDEVKLRFQKTLEALDTQDADIAVSLMEGYREQMTGKSDDIVNAVLRGELEIGGHATTTAVTLYVRYLKRIGAHLKNISTTLINPFDSIGYKE
ncbi:MAG: PhoU domain-containing protein [Candidatus Marinimicrobia bacterium]|jgi:phosphate uptake regulator|nr:PhoU domain-containing protein [Candidatus Neomarinimicrobiota bacterium]MDP6789439.1 PhoU domain-containing protein [Candidatus Neomarinimicrobiota bacterium]MDP7071541.1 PhoU domain-containing protein [Candidatus Neomarinimicrobiota bacterium]|tara:strand:+ start:261 stop:935 length:675 start_codon:yes stop_codon:yes gene_type:complete